MRRPFLVRQSDNIRVTMTFLAGTGNLKHKNAGRTVSSDEEPEGDDVIYQVEKIVDIMWLDKGKVYMQTTYLRHTFDVAAMEKSNFGYAFKVRWKGFGEVDDTWEPIEHFNTLMADKVMKYCTKKGIKLPENFRDWMLPLS